MVTGTVRGKHDTVQQENMQPSRWMSIVERMRIGGQDRGKGKRRAEGLCVKMHVTSRREPICQRLLLSN